VENENRYQPLEPEQHLTNNHHGPTEALNDQILIEEVMAQMDSWTRTVFELRVLGYQFEEIAQILKMRPNLLRSKFHKGIQKLSRRIRG
jgi:DNA-directed RNA polymerase specialized sigma24 family protein